MKKHQINRLDWHTYFLMVAKTISLRSADPRTKVGAVIVDRENKILSTGYNGFPPGFPDTEDNWKPENKHNYVIHAEHNAIRYLESLFFYAYSLYITLEPCERCMKQIIDNGYIKNVYFSTERINEESRRLAKEHNIKLEYIPIDILKF